MGPVATVEFRDADSGDDAFAIVRAGPGVVVLTLSIRGDGDILVALPAAAASELMEALREALARATSTAC